MDKYINRLIWLICLAAVFYALFHFISTLAGLVKILIVSSLIAYILDPLAVSLESRGMSRTPATLVIFLSLFLVLSAALVVVLPALTDQIAAIQEGLTPEATSALVTRLDTFLTEKLSFLGVGDLDLPEKLQQTIVNAGDWVFSHFLDVVGLLTHLVLIPFIVFFLLKDARAMKKQFIRYVPNRYFEFSLNLLSKMDSELGNFLRGQFIDALIVGILSTFALWLLDVKYFMLIGIFTGLANLIPFLGPVAGVTLAVTVSVVDTGSFVAAWYILAAFAGIKLLDDSLIQPVVVARSVHMHPLLVLLVVIIGGKFFGILGMLLSVPATGFLKVALKESILIFRRYRMA
ncbi:MAG: AI-2E family transporter [Thermodesulfovibrionales bacterium]